MLGDALGFLHDRLRMRARDPVLNDIAAELALALAPLGFDIRAAHFWSEQNKVCDRLSRLEQGEQHGLVQLSKAARSVRAATVFMTASLHRHLPPTLTHCHQTFTRVGSHNRGRVLVRVHVARTQLDSKERLRDSMYPLIGAVR